MAKSTFYEYHGRDITYNFYGMNEYTVQYCGDDFMFDTKEEAEKFIDTEINKLSVFI